MAMFGLLLMPMLSTVVVAEPLVSVNPFGVGRFGAKPLGQATQFGRLELLENNDEFKFEAGSQIQANSNVFMSPSGVSSGVQGGKRADIISTSYVGFGLEKDYGMQHLSLSYSLVSQNYKNNTFMDFIASNYEANWFATISPSLKATVSANQFVTPRAPENYGSTPPTQQQITTSQSEGVIFDFSPFQVGHVYAGYTVYSYDTTNSQTEGQINPFYNQKRGEILAGLGYQFSSGTLIKLINKNSNGTQPENLFLAIGSNFNQNENNLSIAWPITGSSNITASYGYLSYTDQTYSNRNYSGQIGGFEYEKKINGDTRFSLRYLRGLQSYITQTNSYDVIDALILSGNWVLTPKFNIKSAVTADQRTYPTISGFANPTRQDKNFVFSLDATWKATQKMHLRATYAHVQRNSNDANFLASTNITNFSAQFYF